jgi:hypothetical protein
MGLRTQPRVSTLGTNQIKRFALKGERSEQMRHITMTPCVRVVSTFDLPPLQGASLGGRFPGLKPWVESYSPFGAEALRGKA